MHGGKMPFADSAKCNHPECHPLNDDRVKKDPLCQPTAAKEEKA